MGDADEGGAAGAQMAGQPGDALDVEVVGGLVEDDQVLLVDEELRQGDPAALTAGERGDDGVEAVLEAGEGEAAEEPGEDVADLGAARPLVVGEVPDDLLPDGLPRVEGVVLGEDAEAQSAVVVTRPLSASSSLASIRMRVVLPSPLRPTTPIRSPSDTPRDTPSSRARVPYTLLTCSTLTRLTAISLLSRGSLW